MSKQNTKRLRRILITVLVIMVVVWWTAGDPDDPQPEQPEESPELINAELQIVFNDDEDKGFALSHPPETSLEEVLKEMDRQELISLEYQDYGEDMGIFIESINDIGGGNEQWWQYWVNEEYQDQGVSQYQIQDDDQIEFRYTAEQEELE